MNVMAIPQISVVMPVHNALPFLDESIRSILAQTLADFEFVIFDDASTDGSLELLREWSRRDQRIHLHESKTAARTLRQLKRSSVTGARCDSGADGC